MIKTGSGDGEASLFEGFTLTGGTSETAIIIENGSEMRIKYNTINAAYNYGIRIRNASPVITDNVISASGSSLFNEPDTIVIQVTGGAPTIERNMLTAGTAPLRSIGIHVYDYAKPVIRENDITAGIPLNNGGGSYGIYCDWYSDPEITGNRIKASASAKDSGKSYGIFSIDSCSPIITDNTIDGGAGRKEAYAIYTSQAGWPVIERNTLFTTGGTQRIGLYMGPNARIEEFRNNNIYGCPSGLAYLYSTYPAPKTITTIAELNEYFIGPDNGEDYFNTNVNP